MNTKKRIITLAICTFFLCAASSQQASAETDDKPSKSKTIECIRNAIADLDKTEHTMKNEFNYWPDCGIRVTGSHLVSLISLKELQSMLPCKLYLSGPHNEDGWNVNDEYDFGHYNPEAIKYIRSIVEETVSDKLFVKLSRPLIDKYLRRQMFILKSLYEALNNKQTYLEIEGVNNRQEVLDDIMKRKGHAMYGNSESANKFLSLLLEIDDGSYVFSNTGDQFLYFWARRYADGTADEIYRIIKIAYDAYFD